MSIDRNKLVLTDLIDVEFLQEFQDLFAKAFGVASITVDDDGPITKPSNFSDFCIKYTRGSEEGYKRCNKCDINFGKIAAQTKKPIVYDCHSGLTDFAVPIFVNEEHVASILGGQILTKEPEEEKFRALASELGIDEEKYIEALRKIKILTPEQINLAADFLYLIANAISKIGHKNLDLIQKNNEEEIYRQINEIIINNIDIEEMKQKIVEIIGEFLEADRCFILQYDKKKDEFLKLKNEYVSGPSVPKFLDINYKETFKNFFIALKQNKDIIVKNREIYILGERVYYENEEKILEKHNVFSLYCIPFFYKGTLMGALVADYLTDKHEITQKETEIIHNISNLLTVGLYRSKLYFKFKKTIANQTAMLNNMPFMAWLKNPSSVLLDVNKEYARKLDTTIENLIGKTDYDLFPKLEAESYIKEDQRAMEFRQTISSNDNISGVDGEKWYETFKSPVIDSNGEILGTVGFSRDITEEKDMYIEITTKTNLLNAILDNIPYWTWLKDLESNYIFVNNQFAKDKNVDINDILNKTDYDFFPEEMAKSYVEADKKTIKFGKPEIIEEITVINDEKCFLETTKVPFRDYKGEIIGTVGIAKNITARKEAQMQLIKKQEQLSKAKERETSIRKFFEIIRSSIDLDIIKTKITSELGKTFNADSCFIVLYNQHDESFSVDKYSEYRTNMSSKSFIGKSDKDPKFKFFVEQYSKRNSVIFSNADEYIVENNLQGSLEEAFLKEYNIKAAYNILISYAGTLLGYLCLNYSDYREFQDEDLLFFNVVATQIGVTLYQASLFEDKKNFAIKETALKDIMISCAKSFEFNEIINSIVTKFGKLLDADRCFFVEYDYATDTHPSIKEFAEYLSSSDITSHLTRQPDKESVSVFTELIKKKEVVIVEDFENYPLPESTKKMLEDLSIKSYLISPVYYSSRIYGALVLHYVKNRHKFNQDEIEIAKAIANQSAIIINQTNLFEKQKNMAEREALLRKITEKIRSSLNIDDTLTFICEETAKLFKVQRSTMVSAPGFKTQVRSKLTKEYKSDIDIQGYSHIANIDEVAYFWEISLNSNEAVISFDNIAESDVPDFFKKSYGDIGVKSVIGTVIRDEHSVWGYLILSEYNNPRIWSEEEKELLNTISQQVFIAIKQSEMYENEKTMLERERVSRNIIEILRSSIDKNIIKKLFVKSIGKYFNASRVLLSEYDSEKGFYLPVEENAEYLKDSSIKSYVNYDWSNSEAIEYIRPLLEMRELNIFNWDEYIKENIKGPEFINFFERENIKSSYNFPIVYQQNIMGFFCIEFIDEAKQLSDEDIARLRSMCTQAGIALYHAKLYAKAQDCLASKGVFKRELLEKIEKPTHDILDLSEQLYYQEVERPVEIEYLNSIINSCHELLNLTHNYNV